MFSADALARVLDKAPGVFFASRMFLASGRTEWVYVNANAAELYDLDLEVMRADPNSLMERVVPEDRARLEQAMGAAVQALAPMTWSGRIQRRDGEVRWIESQTRIERESSDAIVWIGQVLDVTERTRVEQALVESEAARQRDAARYRAVIDALPVGVAVMEPDGTFAVYNPAMERMAGPAVNDHGGDLTHAFGVFLPDAVTPFPTEQLPLMRAFGGEYDAEAEMVVRNAALERGTRLRVTARPLRDEAGQVVAAMAVARDVTVERALEDELRARNEQLAASEEAKSALIERLRFAIDELSNPILEVWDGVLAMPIIGVVDSRRTADMVQRLLAEVARSQASFVIVDLTGVEVVDTRTADHLIKLMRKVEVVGARCVLTGIGPAVAQTLVDIGVDFGRLATLRNLKHGLRAALRIGRRERGLDALGRDEAENDTGDVRARAEADGARARRR